MKLLKSFLDPRLQHKNSGYVPESLHPERIRFEGNAQTYGCALNEIIKFNNLANEFNFMQQIFGLMKSELLWKKLKTKTNT